MEGENIDPTAEVVPNPQPAEETPEKPANSAEGEEKAENDVGGEAAGNEETSKKETPKFDFKFDDEPKKKKKSKKSKKDKQGPKSYSREHYETLIPVLNGQLANLRKIFKRKDTANLSLAKQLATIEVDRVDVCEHLERTHAKREKQIFELESTFEKLKQEYEEYKETSRQRIEELQKLYASVEKQLKGEIELEDRALSSLDEYRVQRNEALKHYQATHERVEDMERQCKEDLFNLEQKNTVQKNVLKKEVKMRLQQVAEDFLHSSEIRNAGYTRNLIRENITLHKTLERRVKQNITIMEEREKQFMKTKEAMESYSSLEQFTEHLAHTIDNKEEIIKRLTDRIERMKTKFVDTRRYQNLCDKATEKQLFNPKAPHNLDDMHTKLEQLKADKNTMYWKTYQQEPEIERLRDLLDKLMDAVAMAISALNTATGEKPTASIDESSAKEMRCQLRKNIIAELIPIVSGTISGNEEKCESPQPQTAAIYRPGVCGFVPASQQSVATQLFCNNTKSKSSTATASNETTSVYGLEFGSYCYYSRTPTIQSSSSGLPTPIEEFALLDNSIEAALSLKQGSAIGGKYRHKRCSCPKKRDSVEMLEGSVDRVILKSSLQFKIPKQVMKREISMTKCFQHHSSKCFGLDSSPYCTDSSSLQDDKVLKSAKPSPSAVTFGSFPSTYKVDKLTSLKEPCECD